MILINYSIFTGQHHPERAITNVNAVAEQRPRNLRERETPPLQPVTTSCIRKEPSAATTTNGCTVVEQPPRSPSEHGNPTLQQVISSSAQKESPAASTSNANAVAAQPLGKGNT